MSDCTANGNEVLRGNVKLPYEGAITAEIEYNADARLTGAVSLMLLGRSFTCSVVADPNDPELALSADSGGFFRSRLVAGAGGLEKPLEPQEWPQGAAVQQVLSAILTAGGETQAADINPDLLSRVVPQWSFTQGTVLSALSALAQYLGVIWRIRDDGRIWLGVPVPAAATAPDYILTEIDPEAGQSTWDLNDASPTPDQIIDGLTLRQVILAFTPGSLRAHVTYAPGPVNGLFRLFGMWLRRVNLEYFRAVPGRIASQSQNTVGFQPDVSTFSPLRRAGIRLGLPDTTVELNASSRGLAQWEAAAPAGPVVTAYEPSPASKATRITLGASAAPPAEKLIRGETYRTQESNLYTAIQSAYTGLPPAATDPASTLALVNAIRAMLIALAADYATFEVLDSQYLTTIVEAG